MVFPDDFTVFEYIEDPNCPDAIDIGEDTEESINTLRNEILELISDSGHNWRIFV